MVENEQNPDLNFHNYYEHSLKLNYAAKENLRLLYEKMKEKPTQESDNEELGLFHASLLLRAVSIENLFKARFLFEIKKEGRINNFNSINDVIKKEWKKKSKNGHEILEIIKLYSIELNENETKFVKNHIEHMVWAGRFPFPKTNKKIDAVNGNRFNLEMKNLISRFAKEMNIRQIN